MRREGCPTVRRRSTGCSPGSPSCLRRALPDLPRRQACRRNGFIIQVAWANGARIVQGRATLKQEVQIEEETRFAGIDISKAQVDVAVRPAGERDGLCPTTKPGSRDWSPRWWTGVPPWCGWKLRADWMPLVAALAAAALPVVVVNPRRIRDFARATGTLAKTDALDAAVLAHFAEAVRPPVRALREAKAQVLNSLAGRRHQMLTMLVSEKNRLGTASVAVRPRIEARISWLKQELEDLDKDLRQTLRQSPIWREKDDLLRFVPGVGEQLPLTLLAHLPELGTLDRWQIAVCGGAVDPSGEGGPCASRCHGHRGSHPVPLPQLNQRQHCRPSSAPGIRRHHRIIKAKIPAATAGYQLTRSSHENLHRLILAAIHTSMTSSQFCVTGTTEVHDFRANGSTRPAPPPFPGAAGSAGNRLGGPAGSLDSVMSFLHLTSTQTRYQLQCAALVEAEVLLCVLPCGRSAHVGTRHGSRPRYPGGAGPRRHRAGLDAPGRGRRGHPGSARGGGVPITRVPG